MEDKKQCPSCGKYVASDKTYCIHCGTSFGVKCPACHKVIPPHRPVCPLCGHSMDEKAGEKRRRGLRSVSWGRWAKAAPWITRAVLLVTVIAVFVLSAFPVMEGALTDSTKKEPEITPYTVTGYDIALHFLGLSNEGLSFLLELKTLRAVTPSLNACLYGQGFGYLLLLFSLAGSLLLIATHLRRFGKLTSRRLLILMSSALGGALAVFLFHSLAQGILTQAIAEAYPTANEGQAIRSLSLIGLSPLFTVIPVGAATVLHLFWHLTVLRKAEAPTGKREYPVRSLLAMPFRALWRLIRRRRQPGEDERILVCTKHFYVYLILLGVSLIFTQALLSKVSHIFFWFMLLLPLPLLVYTLAALKALRVTLLCRSATTEKHTPYSYEFYIENHAPLAFPFIDATVSIPQANSVRCTDRSLRMSMAPLSKYHVKNTVTFRFRGTYDIGVRCFYVYDFFRMFRVRVDIDEISTVYVLPPRRVLDDTPAYSVSDATTRTVRAPMAIDKLEISDIRDYRWGDSLKSIHWKLSSKTEDLTVKDYHTGSSDRTVIFCDLSAHFPDEPPHPRAACDENIADSDTKKRRRKKGAKPQQPSADDGQPAPTALPPDVHALNHPLFYEDMNEYMADGVVELTVAYALAELRQRHDVILAWFDRRSREGMFAYPLRDVEDLEAVYHLFATAPVAPSDRRIALLHPSVNDVQGRKQLFITSSLDHRDLTELVSLPGVSDADGFGSSEVILYNPEERFLHPAERRAYLEACGEQLAAGGMSLRICALPQVQSKGGDHQGA